MNLTTICAKDPLLSVPIQVPFSPLLHSLKSKVTHLLNYLWRIPNTVVISAQTHVHYKDTICKDLQGYKCVLFLTSTLSLALIAYWQYSCGCSVWILALYICSLLQVSLATNFIWFLCAVIVISTHFSIYTVYFTCKCRTLKKHERKWPCG